MESPPPTRISPSEAVTVALLAANGAWTTCCLGGYRAETMGVTCVLLAGVVAWHFGRQVFEPGARGWHPAGWWVLPFLAYAAANVVLVSPVRWLGWRDWGEWCVLLGTFWVVLNGVASATARRLLLASWMVIAALAVVAAGYQHWGDAHWLMLGRHQAGQFLGRASGTFGIPNSLGALLILLLPALVALATANRGGRRVVAAALAAFFLGGLALTISRGAWLSLAAVALLAPFLARGWNWRQRLGAAVLVTLAGGLAVATAAAVSPRVQQRLAELRADAGERTRPILWRGALQIWREHPWFGGGAGSFNPLFEKFRPEGFRDNPEWAHSEYLNTASDYGLVGATLLFGAAAVVGAGAVRHRRQAGAGAFGPRGSAGLGLGLLAFGLHSAVDFHWKIPALALAAGTLAALAVGESWRPATLARFPARLHAILGCGGALLALGIGAAGFRHHRAEAWRRAAEGELEGAAPGQPALGEKRRRAEAWLRRAVAWDPANAAAWADLSGAVVTGAWLATADPMRLGADAEAGADRACRLAPAVAEFWWRRGVARDLQGKWAEAGTDFARALSLSPSSSRVWYYFAYHQSLAPAGIDLARTALATALRLDPGNRAALDLRQRLAIRDATPRQNP